MGSNRYITTKQFSEISPFEDGQRELLEAIVVFKSLQKSDPVKISEEGFPFKSFDSDVIGSLIDIQFIPLGLTQDGIVEFHWLPIETNQ